MNNPESFLGFLTNVSNNCGTASENITWQWSQGKNKENFPELITLQLSYSRKKNTAYYLFLPLLTSVFLTGNNTVICEEIKQTESPLFFVQLCSIFDLSEDMIYLSCQHVMLQALQEVDHVIKDRALHGCQLSQLELAHRVTFCTHL